MCASAPTDMQKDNDRLVKRIAGVADHLLAGGQCQVTRLLPFCGLAANESAWRAYYMFLIDTSRQLFMTGLSLSSVQVISDERKQMLLDSGSNLLRVLYNPSDGIIPVKKDLTDLYREIQAISPGWERVSIHARPRRKLEDPDLLLMEEVLRYSLNRWYSGGFAYFLTQYYVCDYARLRFVVDSRSAGRVKNLAEFWHRYYGGPNVQSAQEQQAATDQALCR